MALTGQIYEAHSPTPNLPGFVSRRREGGAWESVGLKTFADILINLLAVRTKDYIVITTQI